MIRLLPWAFLVMLPWLGGCDCSHRAQPAPSAVVPSEVVSVLAQSAPSGKTTWPLFGGTPARNMVNLVDKNIPTDWSVEQGKEKNVKWQALLGSKSYGGPVVARGKVYVGTNNRNPRDDKLVEKGVPLNMCVLMAFDEASGKFLWQNAHPIPEEEVFKDVKDMGLLSTPVVDEDRIYYVLSNCIVICANADNGKVVWQYDMRDKLKVMPYHCSNCSPLVAGNHIFIVTGNGTDDEGKVMAPDAPSFIALTKAGELAWKSNLPGKNVIEGQWSNPAYAVINGKPQVIFPGGDAVLYSLEPETGKLIWKFSCHAKSAKKKSDNFDNYIVSTPVIHDNKVFVGLGMYPENPRSTKFSWFLCVDATKTGDVSPGTSLDPKAADNKDSALVWAYGGSIEPKPAKGRAVRFKGTISTCAVHEGLVYIPEESGYMNCLDAKTGQSQWLYDFKAGVWGSPYFNGGHVYIGTEDGEVVIFEAGRKLNILNKVDMGEGLHGTPVIAGGVLYVMTKSKLFAIAGK